jgi:hypothetical protein
MGPMHGRVESGVWIANIPVPSPGTLHFPSAGVTISITRGLPLGPVRVWDTRDSTFPLEFGRFRANIGAGDVRSRSVTANGQLYFIAVSRGYALDARTNQAIGDIVASWRFLPLETGTVTGKSPTFQVFGPASDYPLGSVTPFGFLTRAGGSHMNPSYLVHTRRGFYALTSSSAEGGGDNGCPITYVPASRDFACRNTTDGPVWSRTGSPAPRMGFFQAETSPALPLRVLLTRISLDGKVLVAPVEVPIATDLRLTRGA